MKVSEVDAIIFARLKNGDKDAYLAIYNRYHSPVYYFILKYVKIPDLAEDILHDTFLKLWEVRTKIRPEIAGIGYLYRISRNLVFKMMKRISTDGELRKHVIEAISDLAVQITGDQVEWKEYSGLLEDAISLLPPQRQRVFKLCRLEGKTYEETAKLLGLSKNTVKEHMVLAVKFIKEYFYKNADIILGLLLLGIKNK
ncbi:RNA polymerase sigma factor [Pararcticibacter amylolyticus]|uniref:RNA polymerase sigma-70 factor n=1 Tax=Pararcticibacter amylolyticus TaxID=2173175 RepID=A0A2U2PGT6_9SPHI|nr:sigma-70 family RNA polymerase sigma factor [Pararcticibacter amylolyticus]PWG80625.1 RNA polymerase sigma-70 factor [Pararcticibacter amylolyticus]